MYSNVRNESCSTHIFCEMNKQAIAVNHTSYPECENMASPLLPDRFLTLIRHTVRRRHAESIRRRLFIVSRIVHRDVCYRRREEKREDSARELLPVYLALKYTLVHVFGESTIHGRPVPFTALYRSLSFIQRNVNPPASVSIAIQETRI